MAGAGALLAQIARADTRAVRSLASDDVIRAGDPRSGLSAERGSVKLLEPDSPGSNDLAQWRIGVRHTSAVSIRPGSEFKGSSCYGASCTPRERPLVTGGYAVNTRLLRAHPVQPGRESSCCR